MIVVCCPRQAVLKGASDLALQIFFGGRYLDLNIQIFLKTVAHGFKLVDTTDQRIERMQQIDLG